MESFAFVKLEDDDTSELLACRVCLDTESKLFDLHRNGSAVIFGELTGTQVSKRDGLPQYICSICNKLLHKSFTFRTKCRQAHVLLQDARVREPFMTTSHIRTLDRSKFKHKFSYTNALNISIPAEKDINVELEEPSIDKNHEENNLVKSESLIYSDDEMLNDFHESIDHLDIYIGEKDTQVELERSSITEKIDEQNGNLLMKSDTLTYCGDEILNDFNKSIDNLDTDINLEFPAISQENLQDTIIKDNEQEKQKFQEITKEVIKKRAKKKTPPKQKEREPKPKKVRQKKRKRPCNMKFIEDFAEFNETYNCEVLFLTKEQQLKEVEERKESELFKKGRFQCMICFKGFMNDNAHGKHMIMHEESSGDHICEVCQARFDSRKRYLAHNRLHKYRFVCKICDHVSKSSYLAKAHFKWHEGIKYECKDCNKKYNTVSTYFNHKRSYHAPVTCEVCNATVSGTKGLEEHSEKMHSTTKHPCATCKTKFESQEAFDRHLNPDKICFRYLSIPCTKCGERFSNEQMLYKHTESSHGDTVFKCEECHAVFRTDRRLAAHWSLRHSQHYMCEVCAKTFSSECLLQEHQRLHTGEKPFPCPMCPKRFRQKIHLRVHINTHTGERPFKCAHCEDTFKSYSQRHKHILMVHKKERRHKCHMCEKTYVVSFDLKMHIRTYHMKIPLPPPNRKKSRRKQQ